MNPTDLDRITLDPQKMGGKPCIRGMRVTAGTITGLLAGGKSTGDILSYYPYLGKEDIDAAVSYTSRRSEKEDYKHAST